MVFVLPVYSSNLGALLQLTSSPQFASVATAVLTVVARAVGAADVTSAFPGSPAAYVTFTPSNRRRRAADSLAPRALVTSSLSCAVSVPTSSVTSLARGYAPGSPPAVSAAVAVVSALAAGGSNADVVALFSALNSVAGTAVPPTPIAASVDYDALLAGAGADAAGAVQALVVARTAPAAAGGSSGAGVSVTILAGAIAGGGGLVVIVIVAALLVVRARRLAAARVALSPADARRAAAGSNTQSRTGGGQQAQTPVDARRAAAGSDKPSRAGGGQQAASRGRREASGALGGAINRA